MITVKSSAFAADEKIPMKHTGEGEDISPPLTWEGAPDPTKEFALICDDPDAPRDEPFVHWVLYKIPAGQSSLSEGKVGDAVEGKNDFGNVGYGGPMPPPGHGVHHYHFKVYALDREVFLGAGATKAELLKAINGHVLDQGELVGTYERK
jgi:Raf kinase inhibitor-like YbhB/YbcL family protein